MKTLLLIRHAKASWKDEELTDLQRPLNNRGNRDAPFMGKLLREQRIQPDLIISSPALRAMTTARVMAGELMYESSKIVTDESLYNSDVSSMARITAQIDDSLKTVMIVGHNPEITLYANTLTNDSIQNIPTCGVACLQFQIDSWRALTRGSGTLEFLEKPKKYFR
jgi:phosphohistidine phosphatase